MFEIIAIIISLVLFFLNYMVNKDIFYPPALFCLIWSAILVFYLIFISINPADVYRIDGRCFFIFILGEIAFSISGLFAVNRTIKKEQTYDTANLQVPLDFYLFIVLLLVLPFYLMTLMNVIGASSVTDRNAYLILRYEFTQESVDIGPIKYINTITLFAFAIALYKFNFTDYFADSWLKKLYKYLFYVIILFYAVLSTGRTYFLFIACIYLGFKVISKTIKRKHIIVVITLFTLVFAANSFILGKAGGGELSISENLSAVFNSLSNYFLAGVYGLNSILVNNYVLDYGENTFRFFIAIANSAGITETQPKDLVLPYISSPISSNVYTLYYGYIKDFWYAGIGLIMLWGYIHSWFYYRAGRSFFSLYMYSILLYPLVMSFFQDQYMSLLSTWIQLIILGLIATGFISYKNNGLLSQKIEE